MSMEEWRDIPGYGDYEISSFGHVRKGAILMSPAIHCKSDYKYLTISLTKDGRQDTHIVARLVALTYIPNPDNKRTVDHVNRNSFNNHISNLRWATDTEQVKNRVMPVGVSGNKYITRHGGKWRVRVHDAGIRKCIGIFSTLPEAIAARDTFLNTF